jgi:hypothetical protein
VPIVVIDRLERPCHRLIRRSHAAGAVDCFRILICRPFPPLTLHRLSTNSEDLRPLQRTREDSILLPKT